MEIHDCIFPDCQMPTKFGRACEHSCEFEEKQKSKPRPYSHGCLAREVPGATCLAPNCDC